MIYVILSGVHTGAQVCTRVPQARPVRDPVLGHLRPERTRWGDVLLSAGQHAPLVPASQKVLTIEWR